MNKIHSIRQLYCEQGKTIPEIITETGHDRKTITKYLDMTDFNAPEPVTGYKPVKLSPGQISDFGLFPWPLVSSMYSQLFIDQYKTVSITEQGFDPVSAPAAEQKQRTGCQIQFQLIFHHVTEAVNGFAHIGIAADNVDPFLSGDIA